MVKFLVLLKKKKRNPIHDQKMLDSTNIFIAKPSLTPSPLASVTMVTPSPPLVAAAVLVATILQILNRFSQKLLLLITLQQTADNGCSLDLHLFHSNPFLSNRLGRVLNFKPDFGLRSSFLISNKGNVSSIFINVNRKFVLEHFFNVFPGDFTPKTSQFQSSSLGQGNIVSGVHFLLLDLLFYRILPSVTLALLPGLILLGFLFKVVFLELDDQGKIFVFEILVLYKLFGSFSSFKGDEDRPLEMPDLLLSLFIRPVSHLDADNIGVGLIKMVQQLIKGCVLLVEAFSINCSCFKKFPGLFCVFWERDCWVSSDLGIVFSNCDEPSFGFLDGGYNLCRIGGDVRKTLEFHHRLHGDPSLVSLGLLVEELVPGKIEITKVIFNLANDFLLLGGNVLSVDHFVNCLSLVEVNQANISLVV